MNSSCHCRRRAVPFRSGRVASVAPGTPAVGPAPGATAAVPAARTAAAPAARTGPGTPAAPAGPATGAAVTAAASVGVSAASRDARQVWGPLTEGLAVLHDLDPGADVGAGLFHASEIAWASGHPRRAPSARHRLHDPHVQPSHRPA